ncbi:MAG: cation:proton antiporter [Tannerella sp.]|nr:cation:proton antiporter [Tannerella sp.]
MKKLTFYVLMIVVLGLPMYFIAKEGITQHSSNEIITPYSGAQSLREGFRLFSFLTLEHVKSTIGILLLQIIVILATCRIVGLLFKKIGQPTVIGEIMVGVILGPSVLGYFFPQVSGFLFPEESLSYIKTLSQFGLILFMYTIGMELDLSVVRKRFQDTILISHASTIVPFFSGMLMAYLIYDEYAYAETPFLSFALFVGISLSITAFPVLARIIQERGMTRSHLGSISLASAANGDITAWCLLAAVVAYAQAGTMSSAIFIVLFSLVYICIMLFLVRPILRVIGDLYHNKEVVNKPLVAMMFLILLLSSYITEILGLHALFGAFVAGMIMPENLKFRKIMNEKVEDVSLALFLPLFFVYTGLQTEIDLIKGTEMWLLCGVFILVAIIGKFGGTLVAARVSNESWKDSLYMGAFMNTRGLMELVVLSIGLEMNILPPVIFVMLVLMTLVTTFMTTPLISFISICFRTSERIKFHREEKLKTDTFKVLLSFGRASSGQVMLDLAHQMFSKGEKKLDITALHLTVGSDVNPVSTRDFEKVSFAPVLYEANKLNMLIQTRYDVCGNATQHICSIVNNERFNFLLVGSGISMSDLATDINAFSTWRKFVRLLFGKDIRNTIFSSGSLIKDKTKEFVENSSCSVGVFINRGFIRAGNILVIFNSEKDLILLDYVKTLQKTTHGFVQLMDRVSPTSDDSERVAFALSGYLTTAKETAIPFEKNLTTDILRNADLMLVSYDTWQLISEECDDTLQDMPSTLIIKHR